MGLREKLIEYEEAAGKRFSVTMTAELPLCEKLRRQLYRAVRQRNGYTYIGNSASN